MKLSVIIVNYNVTHLLDRCLHSIKQYVTDVDHEILVVDNSSPDISWKSLIEKYPKVHFIANESNAGFAAANNLAAKQAQGEYLLLLNPDTELEGSYMKEILEFADSKTKFGALGMRMHDACGRFLPESKRTVPDFLNSFFKLFSPHSHAPKSKSYYRNDIGEQDISEVEVLTGAFLLIKYSVYRKVGGLDEAYFMYGEDIDLCYTLLRYGYQNYYYGKYSILHHKGESTVKDITYLKRFYGAMQVFLNKYYRRQQPMLFIFMSLGLKLRYGIARLKFKA